MTYVIPAVIFFTLAAVIFIFTYSKNALRDIFQKKSLPSAFTESLPPPSDDAALGALIISLEAVAPEEIKDKSKLAEITDSKILNLIKKAVPKITEIVENRKDAAGAGGENSTVLYRAVIPSGAKLVDSKSMPGAVRGIYMGENGIDGHANLIPENVRDTKDFLSSATSSLMGLASMVVGQYYMSKIRSGIENVNEGLVKISDFQNNEYRSRVFSLVTHVKKITDFRYEIIENPELRLSKISQLDSLEEECTRLLGQANLTLMGYTDKTNTDYESYEKDIKDAHSWYTYQRAAYGILCRISDLRYTLHLGSVSKNQCDSLLSPYLHQIEQTKKSLSEWHKGCIERLKIDTEEIRRKRAGVDGIIHFLPGLFNDKHNFKSIEESTVEMIKEQSAVFSEIADNEGFGLFSEDVQLIIENEKIYYLPAND